jgi:flagellar biosynthetic protein FliR
VSAGGVAVEHYALPVQVFGAGLVFARVGALAMLLPGVGEAGVSPRIRLGLALLLTLVIYPVVRQGFPAVPTDLAGLAGQILSEIFIGLALGALLRLFLGALSTAGEVISLQTTLSFAQTTNPLQAQPTESVSAFLAILGLTLVFVTDLHQLFLAAIVHSYALFPAGRPPPVADFARQAVATFAATFALGIQLAAPVIVFALVFNVALGLVARIMPQFQVFFAATPLTLLLGLSVFALSLGAIGLVWVDRFRAFALRLT